MIRYITFSSYFMEMKKDGFLKPLTLDGFQRKDDYLAFEKDWHGDAYFKAVYIAKNAMPGVSFQPYDLIALIFDEHDLLIKGYQIDDAHDSKEKSGLLSMQRRGELTNDEYNEIGDFIYVKDQIPLDYLKNVDIPDPERLARLGLT